MGLRGWITGGLVIGALIGAAVGIKIAMDGAAAPEALAVALKIGIAGAGAVAKARAAVGATAGAVVRVETAAGAIVRAKTVVGAITGGALVGTVVGLIVGKVVRAGAGAGVTAGAVAGAGAGAEAASSHDTPRTEMDVRSTVVDMEEDEEGGRVLWRREEEQTASRPVHSLRVSRQPFVFFCVLHSNNGDEATSSHSGQNNEETQGTGTQTHHGSTSKQDKAQAARGGAPGGGDPPGRGGGRRDGEDGDGDQEKSDSEEESQQTGEPKKRKSDQKKRKRQRREGATVMTANLRSLNNKELRVLTLVQENQVDVACLTETFLDQNIADRLLSRASGPNFNYQYRNRQIQAGQRRSGGVAMMFSTDLLGEPHQFDPTTTFEYNARLVQHEDWIRSIVFICLYRRPGQTGNVMVQFLLELQTLLDQARLVSQSIIVTGDFNIWVDQEENSSSDQFKKFLKRNKLKQHVDQEMRASRMFQSFLNRNHLQQHVNQPTHNRGHTLDLVVTRNVQISDVSVGEELISDHHPVFFKARPGQSSEEEDKRRSNNNSPS